MSQQELERLYVVGMGAFGREICAWALDSDTHRPVGAYDDGTPDVEMFPPGVDLLGSCDAIPVGARFIVGVGKPGVRIRLAGAAVGSGAMPCSPIIHRSTVVGVYARVGSATIICPNSSIATNARICDHVHVNLNCTIGHDAVVEDYVTLSPGTHLSGNVVLERAVEMGTGSVVLPGVRIGAGATVGAGAVVTSDVTAGTTVVGIPAKPLPAASS